MKSNGSANKPREVCGIFGVYASDAEVARLAFFALYALQHWGQESAGIAISDGHVAHIQKGMGLVAQVFNEENLHHLRGRGGRAASAGIGHTRYSTTGSSHMRNAQPHLIETALGPLAVAHNGNLTNAPSLRQELFGRGVGLVSSSDSEVITQMLAGASGITWEERIAVFMERAQGAYSLTILTWEAVYAVRDPWGFRPLCLGRLNGSGWVVASETCALATIGATLIREVWPGEICGWTRGACLLGWAQSRRSGRRCVSLNTSTLLALIRCWRGAWYARCAVSWECGWPGNAPSMLTW